MLAISPPWLGSWPFWPPSDFSLVNGKPQFPEYFQDSFRISFFTVSFSPFNQTFAKKYCDVFFQRFFEQMSSIKTRKHYVIFDMAFSGLWAFFYFITFVYMCVAWSKTEEIKFNFASSNIIGAIFFAFLSIFAWVKKNS